MFVRNVIKSALVDNARLVGFWWGVAEATVFFVLPDFFLAPAIIANPRQIRRLVLSITIGSAAGALLLTVFITIAPTVMREVILSLPFTHESMITKADQYTSASVFSFIQSISGVPMKVWIWTMLTSGLGFVAFFTLMMGGRLLRFSLVALVAWIIEKYWGETIRRNAPVYAITYVVIFFVFLGIVASST